jgi:hypothetical protein
LLPTKVNGRIMFTPMSDTYSIELKGMTAEQCKEVVTFLELQDPGFNRAAAINAEPNAPELPREFRRALEID